MVLMQDGRLFYTGSHTFGNNIPGTGSAIYDYDANTITDVPGLQRKDERDQSASVLLPPAQDQKVLTIGGGNIDSNPDANRLTDIIDLKSANPAYVAGPPLPQGTVDLGNGKVPQTGNQGKMYVSTVLLPDGKVLETGGALHNRANPVYESSIFDPATETFDPVATDPEARGYHSSAFLLPDGRVMATGDNPGNGSWNHDVSIYTPPYLLKGARPTITSVIDNEWTYGDTQRITVDRPIARAELIRPAAVTHSSDPNQRFVDLPLSVDGNNVDLNVTSNPNLAPPGWYMLFAVDANGVPSVAKWVHLQGPSAMAAAAADAPSAHDHSFADSLEGKVKKPGKKRASAKVSPTIAGCDRHYGSANVCVPTVFPDEVKKTTAARCAWLKENDYGRLKINGKDDPLRLDRDRDGWRAERVTRRGADHRLPGRGCRWSLGQRDVGRSTHGRGRGGLLGCELRRPRAPFQGAAGQPLRPCAPTDPHPTTNPPGPRESGSPRAELPQGPAPRSPPTAHGARPSSTPVHTPRTGRTRRTTARVPPSSCSATSSLEASFSSPLQAVHRVHGFSSGANRPSTSRSCSSGCVL